MVVTGLLFVIALPYGSRGVAVAWVCSFLLLLGPGLSYAGRPVGLRFFSVLGEIGKYIFSASVAGLLCWSLLNWINPCVSFFATIGSVARIFILGCLFGGLYLSVLMGFGLCSSFA